MNQRERDREIARLREEISLLTRRESSVIAMPSGPARRRAQAQITDARAYYQKELDKLLQRERVETARMATAKAGPTVTQPVGPDGEKGEKWRVSSCDVTKLPLQKGGWRELSFSSRDAAVFERRDREAIAEARERIARVKERGETLWCPIPEIIHEITPDMISVYAYVNIDGRRTHIGTLAAPLMEVKGEQVYVTKSSDVHEYGVLADCPGIGRKMYERAAQIACRRGSRIVASRLRSTFSEKLWKRQIESKRATCTGGSADVFIAPLDRLRSDLENGYITVPQFVQLTCNVQPKPPSKTWPCEYVLLNKEVCGEPPGEKPIDLSGLRGRGRYRLTTASRRR